MANPANCLFVGGHARNVWKHPARMHYQLVRTVLCDCLGYLFERVGVVQPELCHVGAPEAGQMRSHTQFLPEFMGDAADVGT